MLYLASDGHANYIGHKVSKLQSSLNLIPRLWACFFFASEVPLKSETFWIFCCLSTSNCPTIALPRYWCCQWCGTIDKAICCIGKSSEATEKSLFISLVLFRHFSMLLPTHWALWREERHVLVHLPLSILCGLGFHFLWIVLFWPENQLDDCKEKGAFATIFLSVSYKSLFLFD